MLEKLEDQFTRYEVARILGARALQIAMDAPLLLKIDEKTLEEINYNPIEIAKKELLAGVLPITVNRPMPKKRESKIKKLTREELEELKAKEEARRLEESKEKRERAEKAKRKTAEKQEIKEKKKEEKAEEGEVKETAAETEEGEAVVVEDKTSEDEIMELATPEDEVEESSSSSEEEGI